MKRNWFLIAAILLITVGMWAQVANSAAKTTNEKAAGCACCNHDMKADAKVHDHTAMDHAAMSGCCGKDAKACSRKDGKAGCCAGMKKGAKLTATDEKGCCKDACTKDCCKDGKCTMAKNGKCCEHCSMGEKTATGL